MNKNLKVFITYADGGYQKTKDRLVRQCESIGVFDKIRAFGPEDVSDEIKNSVFWEEKRGGGLWSWKPDIILSTMNQLSDGDFIVYCDAGCSVYPSKEWTSLFNVLNEYDVIGQLLFKRNEQYTRKDVIDFFDTLPQGWLSCYQFEATILLKVSPFTRKLVKEWRECIIAHPCFIMDVAPKDMSEQVASFIENRHDQAVFSALLYRYLFDPMFSHKIYTMWERIEGVDVIKKQAIRATRLRKGEEEHIKFSSILKRFIKHYVLKPLYYYPRQIMMLKKCYREMDY